MQYNDVRRKQPYDVMSQYPGSQRSHLSPITWFLHTHTPSYTPQCTHTIHCFAPAS